MGVLVVVVALLFPLYEPAIAGVGAIVVIAAATLGFLLRPRRDIFYVRTTTRRIDPDGNLCLEHEQLAIKVELAHLWLLFLPTFLAAAFLVVTAAHGTTWKFSLINWINLNDLNYGSLVPIAFRLFLLLEVGVLWTWICERRILWDADACSATSVKVEGGQVSFQFIDRTGGYGGGEGLYLGLIRPAALSTLVFYRVRKPELNKIGMSLLLHRIVTLGRGLTDLDQHTVTAHAAVAQITS